MKSNLVFKTPCDGSHYFFGYYDKSPVSKDCTKLLALQVSFMDHLPDADDQAVIGYFELTKQDGQFIPVATTKTFNWQQGCMLQWLGPDHESKIIYNDLIDGRFCSVVLDVSSGEKRTLSMAVYSVLPDGRGALCIDNERHHWCRRGYSYDGIHNQEKNKNVVEGDGIFWLDLVSGQASKIIPIESMNRIKPINTMHEGANYLEHLMVSPSGKRFAFLHRWKSFGGIYARLYVADIDGSNVRLINDSGRMSHFCWVDDGHILGWGGMKNPINTLRKYRTFAKYLIRPLMPIYRMLARGDSVDGNSAISRMTSGDSYLLFDIERKSCSRVLPDLLNKDGHPSARPNDSEVFVTDTYPGADHACQLLLVNMKQRTVVEVDRLNSIPSYDNSPVRCDLHPKWSFCGKYVCVDTMHEGVRGMFLYEIHEGVN